MFKYFLPSLSLLVIWIDSGRGDVMKYPGFTTLVFNGAFPDFTNTLNNVDSEQACANNCINEPKCKGFQYCDVTLPGSCNWWISEHSVLFGKPTYETNCVFYYRPELPKDDFTKYSQLVEMKYYERSESPLPSSGHAHWMEKAVETVRVYQDHDTLRYSHEGYLNAPDMGLTATRFKVVLEQGPDDAELLLMPGSDCRAVYPYEETSPTILRILDRLQFSMTPMNLTKISSYANDLEYKGSDSRRGIRTNVWQMPIDKIGNFPVIDAAQSYHISTPYWEGESGNANGLYDLPVSIEVRGSLVDDNQTTPFILRYDLSDYRPMQSAEFSITDFQAGRHMRCTNKKPGKAMPKIADQFSTRLQETYRVGETSSTSTYRLTNRHVYYDFPNQLHRIYSLESAKGSDEYVVTNIIHDFNSDLSYNLGTGDPPTTQECSITRLTATDTNDFPDVNSTDNGLYLVTTQALFDLDNANFQYRGRETERGILCDAWIGQDPEFFIPALGLNLPVTIEVYFIAQDSSGGGTPPVYYDGKNIPLYMDVTSTDVDFNIRFHYYDVLEQEPEYSHYDITPCFSQSDLVDFQITFSVESSANSAEEAMRGRERSFDQALRVKIRELTEASPIRFQNIRVSYEGNQVHSMLRMSEQIPKDQYDPDKDKEKQNEAVYAELVDLVGSQRLVVSVPGAEAGSEVVTLTSQAIRNDIVPAVTLGPPQIVTRPTQQTPGGGDTANTSGYSTGAMAGLAIGMLILGLILSVGILLGLKYFKTANIFNRQSQEKLENDFSTNA